MEHISYYLFGKFQSQSALCAVAFQITIYYKGQCGLFQLDLYDMGKEQDLGCIITCHTSSLARHKARQ